MNEEQIIFWIDERKFTTKLVSNAKLQNKVHYYTISELEDIINLILTEDDITETMEEDDESHPIIVKLEEKSTSSDSETEMIPDNLKGKFLDEAITSYKAKCRQYIEQRKAKQLASYLK